MKLQIICVVATEGAEGKDKKQREKNKQVENFPPLKEEKLFQRKSLFCFSVKDVQISTPSANPTEMEKSLVNKKKIFNSSSLVENKFW